MAPVGRILIAIAYGAAAVMQSVAASVTPTPSPALDGLLVSPGADYTEVGRSAPGALEGPFDAAGYVAFANPANPTAATATLQRDGFISGYGRTWVLGGAKRVFVEAAIAFTGGDGANKFLVQSEIADKAYAHYLRPLTINGIDTYYGFHDGDPVSHVYVDGFLFVKGNDTFVIAAVSQNDDLGDAAATQTSRQFDAAPPYTIPPAKWPGAAPGVVATRVAFNAGQLVADALIGVLILGLTMLAVGLVLRSRRRPQPAYATPTAAVHMSADGQFWWDGVTWRDSGREIPPAAQRSGDGQFWWDGTTWRPVPHQVT
jgi:hypothetical protein